ncbi:hypothetical protein E2C01_044000 [Portunus trituberculatus]|uniref:Uncharacterized protein n=1 Tax=Portunus trituberculatus TaxID=210409 RepID=A0A5B7FX68_PORTR|nr:hypothetical protein [Portunus trituberculatus]
MYDKKERTQITLPLKLARLTLASAKWKGVNQFRPFKMKFDGRLPLAICSFLPIPCSNSRQMIAVKDNKRQGSRCLVHFGDLRSFIAGHVSRWHVRFGVRGGSGRPVLCWCTSGSGIERWVDCVGFSVITKV